MIPARIIIQGRIDFFYVIMSVRLIIQVFFDGNDFF